METESVCKKSLAFRFNTHTRALSSLSSAPTEKERLEKRAVHSLSISTSRSTHTPSHPFTFQAGFPATYGAGRLISRVSHRVANRETKWAAAVLVEAWTRKTSRAKTGL